MSNSNTPKSPRYSKKSTSKSKMSSKLKLNNSKSGESIDGNDLAEIDEDGHEHLQIEGESDIDAHTEPLAKNPVEELESKFLLKYDDMIKETDEEPISTFKLKANHNYDLKRHF